MGGDGSVRLPSHACRREALGVAGRIKDVHPDADKTFVQEVHVRMNNLTADVVAWGPQPQNSTGARLFGCLA